jgi:thiol-disulfide isomerase/thioredoxin
MKKNLKILSMALLCQITMATGGWSAEVGEAMPDFHLNTLAGDSVSRAGLSGKPLLLVFWNTWCPSCKKELPRINQLAERYSGKGVTVLAINTGLNDSESKARAFWKKNGYLFATGFDHSFEIGQSFRVQGVPTLLLVDARGVVQYKSSLIPDDIDQRIRQLTGR